MESVGKQRKAVLRRIGLDRDLARILARDPGARRDRATLTDGFVRNRGDRGGRIVQEDFAIGVEAGVEQARRRLLVAGHVTRRVYESHARRAVYSINVPVV